MARKHFEPTTLGGEPAWVCSVPGAPAPAVYLGVSCTNHPAYRCTLRPSSLTLERLDCFVSGQAEMYEDVLLHRFEATQLRPPSAPVQGAVVALLGEAIWQELSVLLGEPAPGH